MEDFLDPEGYKLTEEQKEEFKQLLEEKNKQLTILCGGPTGVGKSTLLNGLIGLNTEEIKPFKVGYSLNAETLEVTAKKIKKGGVEITLWDTPGLEGDKEVDENYLQKIKETCATFDFFLYCINGSEARATELFDEKSSLIKYHRLFGKKLWKRSAVILTQANLIAKDLEQQKECDDSDIDVCLKFTEKIEEWRVKIHQELIKNGVDKKKAKKVPVVPAGIARTPSLPGIQFWLSNVFEKILERMGEEAQIALLAANTNRMKSIDEVNEDDNIGKQNLEDQPIVFTMSDKIATAAVTTVGATTGAGIGAAIGALLIGIPSFGAFAGVGLVVGGVVGGAIGSGGAIATSLALKFFKKRKGKKASQKD